LKQQQCIAGSVLNERLWPREREKIGDGASRAMYIVDWWDVTACGVREHSFVDSTFGAVVLFRLVQDVNWHPTRDTGHCGFDHSCVTPVDSPIICQRDANKMMHACAFGYL
jgi:hypothetical protein